jgi:hypothetical protein
MTTRRRPSASQSPARRFLVGPAGREVDRLDVQRVAPVGLLADHTSEHRFFRLDPEGKNSITRWISSLTTA